MRRGGPAKGLWVAVFVVSAVLGADGHAAAAAAPTAAAGRDTLPVARMNVPQAMLAATRSEILLVDVRPAGQRALGHIRGDVHVPIEQLAARQSELPRNRRLVFYCSCHAEELALDAARILLAAGHAQVAVLLGGYDDWRTRGGPTQVEARWEDVFRVSSPPSGWGKTPVDSARCGYARDGGIAARGTASARIACRSDTAARGFAGYTQKLDAALLRGRKVTLTAMVRTEAAARGAYLWIAAEDAQGRMMGLTNPASDPIVGSQEWRQHEVSGVVPPVAVRLLIGVSLTGSGRLWLDDVRLVAPEGPGMPRLRPVVVNHGFEE